MKIPRKSQVTVFIIIGLLIVITYFLLRIDTSKLEKEKIDIQLKKDQVLSYLDLCIKDYSYDSLMKISEGGGVSSDSVMVGNKTIAFWNDGASDKSPSLEEFQLQVSSEISTKVENCYLDLSKIFKDVTFEFGSGRPKIITSFYEDHTEVKSKFPVKIRMDQESTSIDEVSIRMEYNFKIDFELSKRILKEALQRQPGYYDVMINCFNYNTNWKTNIYTIDLSTPENYVVVSIIDYEPKFRDLQKTLRLNFALKDVNIMGYCAG